MAATIANTVDEADFGVAGAMQQLAVQVGAVIGIQIMQTVQAAREEPDGLVASLQLAYCRRGCRGARRSLAALFIEPTKGQGARGRV